MLWTKRKCPIIFRKTYSVGEWMIQIKMGHLGYLCNYTVPVKIHIFRFFFICNPLMSAILFTHSNRGTRRSNRAEKNAPAPVDVRVGAHTSVGAHTCRCCCFWVDNKMCSSLIFHIKTVAFKKPPNQILKNEFLKAEWNSICCWRCFLYSDGHALMCICTLSQLHKYGC